MSESSTRLPHSTELGTEMHGLRLESERKKVLYAPACRADHNSSEKPQVQRLDESMVKRQL
jgi:hypothetical protein